MIAPPCATHESQTLRAFLPSFHNYLKACLVTRGSYVTRDFFLSELLGVDIEDVSREKKLFGGIALFPLLSDANDIHKVNFLKRVQPLLCVHCL
jgi:hypothetical protein